MRVPKLIYLVLIASCFSSCLTTMLYDTTTDFKKGQYIVKLDSVFLTDSNEVVVYYKTRLKDDSIESVRAVIDQNLPEKIRERNKYLSVKATQAEMKGAKVRQFTITDHYDAYKMRKYQSDSLDSIDYDNRVRLLDNYPDGYVMGDHSLCYKCNLNDSFRNTKVYFTYLYNSDTGVVMEDINIVLRYRVRHYQYLPILPITVAADAVLITAGVAIAIPVAIGWGIYELLDGKK